MSDAGNDSALQTEAYFRERRERAGAAAFDAWLAASPNVPPMPGDELPPELAATWNALLDKHEKTDGTAT